MKSNSIGIGMYRYHHGYNMVCDMVKLSLYVCLGLGYTVCKLMPILSITCGRFILKRRSQESKTLYYSIYNVYRYILVLQYELVYWHYIRVFRGLLFNKSIPNGGCECIFSTGWLKKKKRCICEFSTHKRNFIKSVFCKSVFKVTQQWRRRRKLHPQTFRSPHQVKRVVHLHDTGKPESHYIIILKFS